MQKTLLAISSDYRELLSEVEAQEGELSPETAEKLQINRSEYKQKAEAYLYHIKAKEARIEEARKIAEQCRKVIEREERQINWLKSVLLKAVQLFGGVETTLFKVSKRKSTALQITALELIPDRFLVKTETISADKKAIKEAILAGEAIKGAEIIENESLQIS